MKIGVFDSGVGGLGIFKAVAALLPAQDIVYVADNANLPFGQKTTEQLQRITEKIVRFLVEQQHVKLVIVACNTASVSSLEYLRQNFSVPIVGVVPVVKPACEQSKVKKVAILATKVTAESAYQQELIKKYANGASVLSIGCPGLVELVEAGLLDAPETHALLKQYLAPALDAGVDIIGLACTHYPFLIEQIKKIVPPSVVIIDSNEAVARHVVRLLASLSDSEGQPRSCGAGDKRGACHPGLAVPGEALSEARDPGSRLIVFATKEPERFHKVAQRLIGDLAHDVPLIVL